MKNINRFNPGNFRVFCRILLVVLPGWLGSGSTLSAQPADILPALEKALTAGNSRDIAAHFSDHVNLAIPGTDGVFSKEQAGVILKDFFTRNKPTHFKTNHKGKSGEGASYFVGTLTCGKKKFSLYVLMRESGAKSTIRQFQVEED